MKHARIALAAMSVLASCTTKTDVVREPNPQARALIARLPDGCDNTATDAPIAFVAKGRVWTTNANGSTLGCAFALGEPGAFEWGPRSDRVVSDGLEVRDTAGKTLQQAIDVKAKALSWGHPTGKSIAYVDASTPESLRKITLGGSPIDITPVRGVNYAGVEYHPSGLGIAVAVEGKNTNAVWLSSNTGTNPKRLIGSTKGTRFGALAFEADGQTLLYAATLSDGTSRIGRYFLTEGTSDEGLWGGAQPILRLARKGIGRGVAFDVGTGCDDRTAMYSDLDQSAGQQLLPDAATPTTALGRVSETKFLVAAGACNGPFDLWIADVSGEATLLIKHVDRGAVRVPDPSPPPGMPEVGVSSRFF